MGQISLYCVMSIILRWVVASLWILIRCPNRGVKTVPPGNCDLDRFGRDGAILNGSGKRIKSYKIIKSIRKSNFKFLFITRPHLHIVKHF